MLHIKDYPVLQRFLGYLSDNYFLLAEPIVFNGSILWASYQFLQLARQWPQLMRRWARVESHLPPYASWKEREQLARRIHSVASVLLLLSLS